MEEEGRKPKRQKRGFHGVEFIGVATSSPLMKRNSAGKTAKVRNDLPVGHLWADRVEEPRAGESPMASRGALADAERLGGFLHTQPDEIAELHDLGLFGI